MSRVRSGRLLRLWQGLKVLVSRLLLRQRGEIVFGCLDWVRRQSLDRYLAREWKGDMELAMRNV